MLSVLFKWSGSSYYNLVSLIKFFFCSKTSQRHLFLFEKEMLICKQQNVDAADNNINGHLSSHATTASSGTKKQCYLFKNSLKVGRTLKRLCNKSAVEEG